ncbi:hypothetical protein [Halobacillus sp. KGW1]|uniref:hypothetical protein n=1 Tax=Halobacillus sp. KGW1 TaxID=1793726 RepID=UPI001372A02C|nr:hypothetical protein [Halobacillus sp. KGW1]
MNKRVNNFIKKGFDLMEKEQDSSLDFHNKISKDINKAKERLEKRSKMRKIIRNKQQ